MKSLVILILATFLATYTFAACPTIIMGGNDVSCHGASDGEAQVSITSGGSNYTFTWSNGTMSSTGLTSSINGLSKGTYTVSVRDNASGCTVTGAFVVGSPDPISLSGIVNNVNCFGDATGGVNISVNGGVQPYSFSWVNSSGTTVSTSQNLSNVPAGVYTVTVNAPNASCSVSQSFEISQPIEGLDVQSVIQNVDCFGNSTGAITVETFGGTPPYSFSWSNGALTQSISGVSANNYNLLVTDSKGCSRSFTFNITQPNPLSFTHSVTNVLCHGENTGAIDVNVSGGTPSYTFLWKNDDKVFSQNTSTLTNIEASNYTFDITDGNGCKTSGSAVVNEPTKLTGSIAIEDVSCFGFSDGNIFSTISGGSPNYNYQWLDESNNVISSTADLENVVSGTYGLHVTDNNGCEIEFLDSILQPEAPISVTYEVEDVLCHGDNTGKIDLFVEGGTTNYTYFWNTGQNNATIENLFTGNYDYVVTDANGCTEAGSIFVDEPSQPLSVSPQIDPVDCFGNSTGSIVLNEIGGTPNYSFKWSNSQYELSSTGNSLIDYPADVYWFEITDENDCKLIDTLEITEPPLLESEISGVDILCKGGNNGSVDLVVTGGTPIYSYSWNNGSTSQNLSNLYAGGYDVVVTDMNNCTTTNQIVLTEPVDSLQYSFEVTDVTCNDGSDGAIDLDVWGGTPNYSYTWSNGSNNPIISQLTAGFYSFLVEDNNGCTVFDSAFVDQPDPILANSQITNATCHDFSNGSIITNPTGGTPSYKYTWYSSDFSLANLEKDLIDFPADVYTYVITDTNDCENTFNFEITHPEPVEVTYEVSNVSCFDGVDGDVYVEVVGGTPNYDFLWSNGETTQNIIGQPLGTYQLTVTDQQNCVEEIDVQLVQPEPITMEFSTTEVSCIDQYDGTASVFPIGGNGGYSYQWNNGQTSFTATGLESQSYFVTVTDILGCTGTDSVFIERDMVGCVDPVNAFSPNGDNYNDRWEIDNMELYPDANVKIFSKWGRLIHEQNGVYEPWDGTFNGNDLPAEVYYWIIVLNNEDDDILKGNLTIIR